MYRTGLRSSSTCESAKCYPYPYQAMCNSGGTEVHIAAHLLPKATVSLDFIVELALPLNLRDHTMICDETHLIVMRLQRQHIGILGMN